MELLLAYFWLRITTFFARNHQKRFHFRKHYWLEFMMEEGTQITEISAHNATNKNTVEKQF